MLQIIPSRLKYKTRKTTIEILLYQHLQSKTFITNLIKCTYSIETTWWISCDM